jgi:hypothetical protein
MSAPHVARFSRHRQSHSNLRLRSTAPASCAQRALPPHRLALERIPRWWFTRVKTLSAHFVSAPRYSIQTRCQREGTVRDSNVRLRSTAAASCAQRALPRDRMAEAG